MLQASSLWENVLEIIRQKVSPMTYNNNFKYITPVSYKDGVFLIATDSETVYDTVNAFYVNEIRRILEDELHEGCTLEFVLGDPSDLKVPDAPPAPYLNPKYTFETFVVGESNKMAHAAALAITEFFPETRYNPFFLHSGVGLGKTHLIHAIGNEIYRRFPDKKILYVSSETFTNEVISAIRPNPNDTSIRTAQLRRKYRDVDVLMIDDIQFIAGKASTESEFFHTFNALFLENKQIIITSDRPPQAIPVLDNRMKTRFSSGIVMDIQSPDFETRAAILRNRARLERVDITPELINAIAERVDTNIRELEGAFNTVVAHAQLTNSRITYALIDRVLRDMVHTKESHRITLDMVVTAVSDYYSIPEDEIRGKKRDKMIALTRQLAMYLCRELTESSLKDIGEEFGGKHHSTVLHACETIEERLRENPGSELQVAVDDIKSRLKNL